MEVKIQQSWKNALAQEFEKPYFESLVRFLHQEKAEGKTIFPPGSQIFRAFDLTPVDKVKVVILGQDPYFGEGEAHGLAFSVPDGVKMPPTLKNIFKEYTDYSRRDTRNKYLHPESEDILFYKRLFLIEGKRKKLIPIYHYNGKNCPQLYHNEKKVVNFFSKIF